MGARRLSIAALAALALVATGCGDDKKKDSSTASTATTQPPPATTSTPTPQPPPSSASSAQAPKVTGKPGSEPKIAKPSGNPPTTLVIKDLVKGKGPEAKAGEMVTVQYVGADWDSGKVFDASWSRNEPFSFALGAGQVIPGWDQGVVGMKVGGRRELVIPPDLGYGAQGSPPAIPPNATLVFVIDLLKVGPAGG